MSKPRVETVTFPEFRLDSGLLLRDVRVAYGLLGEIEPGGGNVVLVFHSLTGGPADLGGFYPEVVGPGRPVDTGRWAVVCPNLIGSCYGTTYREAAEDSGRAAPTTRDMARLTGLLLDALGARRVALATGGSLGGMVALEWAATFPERSNAVVVFAAPAAHTAWGIGWNHIQRLAVEKLGAEGLAIARMAGMLTYRTPDELESRFGRKAGTDAPFAIQSYLTRHGEKLVARFDTKSYLTLLDAMDSHDVARGRGGLARALGAFRGRLTGVGIPGDVLYGPDDVKHWTHRAGAAFRQIRSLRGHDGFLLELGRVGDLLATELASATAPARRRIAGLRG
ncbi:MAG TPA: alpha/beta fold hydrolase [Thermoanaerobaculia bacterium]|nr:alpha/beta fold hydrolase [Thermoanaerobaculia bacterium]